MAVLFGFAICLRYRQGGENCVNDLRSLNEHEVR